LELPAWNFSTKRQFGDKRVFWFTNSVNIHDSMHNIPYFQSDFVFLTVNKKNEPAKIQEVREANPKRVEHCRLLQVHQKVRRQ
jgi:hypothetical protein